jgi:hypothetical protein
MNLTPQKALNKIWDYFITQGKAPGRNSDGDCQFRGAYGTKCAIGCLIPDRKYKKDMEGHSAYFVLDMAIPNHSIPPSLATSFQSAHDNAADSYARNPERDWFGITKSRTAFKNELKENLAAVARDYGLKLPAK